MPEPRFPQVMGRLFNQPLMIEPGKLDAIVAGLSPRLGGEAAAAAIKAAANDGNGEARYRPYRVTGEGVAVIPVVGTLVQRSGWLDAMSGLVSYQSVDAQLAQALEDQEVRAILLEVDSFGGEVAGLFDLVDVIHQARTIKPVWAVANETAFSAGYAVLSAAERVYLPRTAGVGSVGVVAMLMDQSAQDQTLGLKYHAVHAGAHKIDFNPHFPFSEQTLARVQVEVDQVYDLFTGTVARNRGLGQEAVRATEAGLYFGARAVEAGLSDGVASLEQVVSALGRVARGESNPLDGRAAARREEPQTEEKSMSEDKDTKQEAAAEQPRKEPEAAQVQEAPPQLDAKARVKAILDCAEAKDRPKLARSLALNTDLSPEEATAVLADAAPETQAQVGGFFQAMGGLENPDVGLPGEDRDDNKAGQDLAANMNRLVAERYGRPEGR